MRDQRNKGIHPQGITLTNTIAWVVLAAAGLLSVYLPRSGYLSLAGALLGAVFFWGALAMLLHEMQEHPPTSKGQSRLRMIVAVIAVIACLWVTKDPLLDLATGPRETVLTNVRVHKTLNVGIMPDRYYLAGDSADGRSVSLTISLSDYERIGQGQTLSVTYYHHTERLIRCGSTGEQYL